MPMGGASWVVPKNVLGVEGCGGVTKGCPSHPWPPPTCWDTVEAPAPHPPHTHIPHPSLYLQHAQAEVHVSFKRIGSKTREGGSRSARGGNPVPPPSSSITHTTNTTKNEPCSEIRRGGALVTQLSMAAAISWNKSIPSPAVTEGYQKRCNKTVQQIMQRNCAIDCAIDCAMTGRRCTFRTTSWVIGACVHDSTFRPCTRNPFDTQFAVL